MLTSCWVHTGIVGKAQLSQLPFPVEWILMDSSGQHVEDGAVQPLNQPIRLRVVRCSSGLDPSKEFIDLNDDI